MFLFEDFAIEPEKLGRLSVKGVPRGEGAGAEKGVDANMLQSRLKEATDRYIDVVKVTAKDTDETIAEVPFFGKVSAKGWLLFQIAHDLDHLKQAQVLRRSADFPRKN